MLLTQKRTSIIFWQKLILPDQRYRIFFFRGKVYSHSLTRFGHFLFFYGLIFFFRPCFFFPRKSLLATHSTEKIQPAKKGKKKPKNGIFCRFSVFRLFFSFYGQKLFFFFPGKVYLPLTHSISEGGKKNSVGKKNRIFTHSLEKPQKGANFKLFQGKKKYGTFDQVERRSTHKKQIPLPQEF